MVVQAAPSLDGIGKLIVYATKSAIITHLIAINILVTVIFHCDDEIILFGPFVSVAL